MFISFLYLCVILIYIIVCTVHRSWGSSVSIVSDYGLHDWEIGVRSLADTKDFSSRLRVQTGSEAHLASYPMGTGGVLFPGVKRGRGVTLTTHPHVAPRSRIGSYIYSPLWHLHVNRERPTLFVLCYYIKYVGT
jgi:hypothetical protein